MFCDAFMMLLSVTDVFCSCRESQNVLQSSQRVITVEKEVARGANTSGKRNWRGAGKHTRTHTCTHAHTPAPTHTHTHTPAHTNTHIHTHAHRQRFVG
jgi:hypothetical protein